MNISNLDKFLSSGLILPLKEDDLLLLTKYAVQTRYPSDDPILDEAKHALDIAKAVCKYAKPLLP